MTRRCAWAADPAMLAYYGLEWGVRLHDDRLSFEFLERRPCTPGRPGFPAASEGARSPDFVPGRCPNP
ncbi:MAG TPA: hypothetical protein VI942_02420, partial [Thermoanaerobaculia bacterium]|nr:hypothetical protein [Thermoanaerobaculia bacterium]